MDGRLKFSMCAKPHEFIEEIIKTLNERDGEGVWYCNREHIIESTEKTIEFNHVYCDAALSSVAETFETEYEVIDNNTGRYEIALRKVEYFKAQPLPLSYGRGNGFIPGVGRTTETDGAPIKRLYVQGGEQNIDRATYGSTFGYSNNPAELRLPKGQSLEYEGRTYTSDEQGYYIERTDKISTATKEDSLDCSEIYPSYIGTVTSVSNPNSEKNWWDIVDINIPDALNFNNYIIAGESMTLIFQSGMLAGKEFEVKYKHEFKRWELVPMDEDGITYPNATFKPNADPDNPDTYAVFGIMLPEAYICDNTTKTGAAWDMFKEAARYLYEHEDQKFTFAGELQSLYAKRHWLEIGGYIKVGAYIHFTDEQFAADGLDIRIIGVKDYINAPYSPTLEISNSIQSPTTTSSQIQQIGNTEVAIDDTKKKLYSYTKRRFRDALETIGLLSNANIGDFGGNIAPIAVHTMALLAGDESLQFRFVYKSITTDSNGKQVITYHPTTCISYNQDEKKLYATMRSAGMDICLQHLTLGQHAIMSQERRDADGYVVWPMISYESPVLDEPSRTYYLYAKVSSSNLSDPGGFVLSEKAISMDAENGYYHLLCGVLNSEINGSRSYVSLYGFTEILPGRITTDLIISNDGKTYFDLEKGEIGGALKFLSDNGYITIIEGGKIKTELIDVSQLIARSVIVGEPNRQRVEIQPDSEGNGSVKIYDDNNNEVTVFEGQSYSAITDLYDGSTGADCEILKRTGTATVYGYGQNVTLGRGKVSKQASSVSTGAISEDIPLSKVWHTATPTEVELKAGKLYAQAYSAGYTKTTGGGTTTSLQPDIMSSASAFVQIRIETYANYNEETGALSNRVHSATIVQASASASASQRIPEYDYNDPLINDTNPGNNYNRPITTIGGSSSTTVTYQSDSHNSGIINVAGKKIRVPAGYHRLVLWAYCNAQYTGSNASASWGNSGTTDTDITAKWISDFYVSRYFANGFCLGTRSDNYILAYKTEDGMRFVMENDKIGFDFSKNGIRTRARGTNWMPLPMLIYKASYYYLSTNDTYNLNSTHGYKTFNNQTLPATRTGKGLVTLTFPDSWKADLGSIGVENLLVQVNAHHKVIDARIESITTSAIKVAMSDDASLNDGDFGIVIYYIST